MLLFLTLICFAGALVFFLWLWSLLRAAAEETPEQEEDIDGSHML